jgi:hypothetical protein
LSPEFERSSVADAIFADATIKDIDPMRAKYEVWLVTVVLSVCPASPSLASGDFPRSSCKTWNGTVVAMSGVNTSRALMRGIITRADVQEYCDRDPGEETVQYGPGKLTIPQCVARYYRKLRNVKLLARADCARATLEFHDGGRVERLKFPTADTSCSSGHSPLISQFNMLCPKQAQELEMTWPQLAEKARKGR